MSKFYKVDEKIIKIHKRLKSKLKSSVSASIGTNFVISVCPDMSPKKAAKEYIKLVNNLSNNIKIEPDMTTYFDPFDLMILLTDSKANGSSQNAHKSVQNMITLLQNTNYDTECLKNILHNAIHYSYEYTDGTNILGNLTLFVYYLRNNDPDINIYIRNNDNMVRMIMYLIATGRYGRYSEVKKITNIIHDRYEDIFFISHNLDLIADAKDRANLEVEDVLDIIKHIKDVTLLRPALHIIIKYINMGLYLVQINSILGKCIYNHDQGVDNFIEAECMKILYGKSIYGDSYINYVHDNSKVEYINSPNDDILFSKISFSNNGDSISIRPVVEDMNDTALRCMKWCVMDIHNIVDIHTLRSVVEKYDLSVVGDMTYRHWKYIFIKTYDIHRWLNNNNLGELYPTIEVTLENICRDEPMELIEYINIIKELGAPAIFFLTMTRFDFMKECKMNGQMIYIKDQAMVYNTIKDHRHLGVLCSNIDILVDAVDFLLDTVASDSERHERYKNIRQTDKFARACFALANVIKCVIPTDTGIDKRIASLILVSTVNDSYYNILDAFSTGIEDGQHLNDVTDRVIREYMSIDGFGKNIIQPILTNVVVGGVELDRLKNIEVPVNDPTESSIEWVDVTSSVDNNNPNIKLDGYDDADNATEMSFRIMEARGIKYTHARLATLASVYGYPFFDKVVDSLADGTNLNKVKSDISRYIKELENGCVPKKDRPRKRIFE